MTALSTDWKVVAESSVQVYLKAQYLMKYSGLGTTSATVHRKIRFIATGNTWFSGTWSYSGTSFSGSKNVGTVSLSNGGTYDFAETSGSVTLSASGGYYTWSQTGINVTLTGDRTFSASGGSASITGGVVTYAVTLDDNGGSGGSGTIHITHGTTTGNYPSIKIPSRANYSFNGYYSAKTGGTQWYNAQGNSVRNFDNATHTWYAQWTATTQYTITYQKNGGSGGASYTTGASGATVYFTDIVPHKTGHRFKEWNSKADGTGTHYAPGASHTLNGNLTVYAIYEQIPNVYNIWVKINGEWRH